jgi:hypothetical protein
LHGIYSLSRSNGHRAGVKSARRTRHARRGGLTTGYFSETNLANLIETRPTFISIADVLAKLRKLDPKSKASGTANFS